MSRSAASSADRETPVGQVFPSGRSRRLLPGPGTIHGVPDERLGEQPGERRPSSVGDLSAGFEAAALPADPGPAQPSPAQPSPHQLRCRPRTPSADGLGLLTAAWTVVERTPRTDGRTPS
ncbi:hypothetical protein ACFVTC_02100 [Streptomyces sp. NPDC057950]|uniref:hypothetical protein n=1 Tax=Streptomyces sp. NPDC057950 TaxID=3346288 RepID=UPI0036E75F97